MSELTQSNISQLVSKAAFDPTHPGTDDPLESKPVRNNYQALMRANDLRAFATSPSSDKVIVASGIYSIDKNTVLYYSGDVTWEPSGGWPLPSDGEKIILIGFTDDSSSPQVVAEGSSTTSGNPSPPDIPKDIAPVAFVLLNENTTNIEADNIFDARYMVSAPVVNEDILSDDVQTKLNN